VKRFFAAATWSDWQDGWHFLSSPVAGQPFNEEGGFITGGEGNEFDLYAWSEPNDQWVNIKNTTVPPLFSTVNPGNEFVAGKGYLAAYQQQGDKTFTGVLNVSDVPVDNLTVTGTGNHGWHLLGNPFASGLVWYSDWVTSNIGGVAYTWNEAGMSYTPRNPGDIIPTCNGFMVRVIENPDNTGSLIIPAAKRVHGSQAWFKESEYPVITLFARNLDNRSFQDAGVERNLAAGHAIGIDLFAADQVHLPLPVGGARVPLQRMGNDLGSNGAQAHQLRVVFTRQGLFFIGLLQHLLVLLGRRALHAVSRYQVAEGRVFAHIHAFARLGKRW
jgi:hypothetical protein